MGKVDVSVIGASMAVVTAARVRRYPHPAACLLAVALAACTAAKSPELAPADAVRLENTVADIVGSAWIDRTLRREVRTTAALTGAEAAAIPEVREAAIEVHNTMRGLRFRALVFMPLLDRGVLGVAHDGTLVQRADLPPSHDSAETGQLLESENTARRALPALMAALNAIPASSTPAIAQMMARAWRTAAKAGWWVEEQPGAWVKR